MSANTAMNVFMRAVAETKSIPFTIGKRSTDTRQKFGDVLSQVLEENRKLDRPELTLEEINAEIAAARADMKARKEKLSSNLYVHPNRATARGRSSIIRG